MTEQTAIVGADSVQPTEVEALLAYYDAREVSPRKLRAIFRCTDAELAEAREAEGYLVALQNETAQIAGQAAETDDLWDSVEHEALGSLQESLAVTSDPRTLLSVATHANRAGRRRSGGVGGGKPQPGRAEIDVNAQTQGTKVVRLRARFIEQLSDPNGARRIRDRQVEIEAADNGDLMEDLSPGVAKRLLREGIGVDTEDLVLRKHAGPDASIELDFSKIAEEYGDG